MQPRLHALVSLILLGCGAGCPPGERAGPAGPNTNAERRPVAPVVSGDLGMDGRWVIAEANRGANFLLEVQGERARMVPVGQGSPLELRVVSDGPGPVRLVAGSDEETMFWVPRGAHRAILFNAGDDDMVLAYRTAEVPAELQGLWEVRRAGREEVVEFRVDGSTLRMTGGEDVQESGPLYGIAESGEGLTFAAGLGGRSRLQVVHLQSVGDGSYLAFETGDDDLLVVSRPGSPPRWLRTRPTEVPRPLPPPPG